MENELLREVYELLTHHPTDDLSSKQPPQRMKYRRLRLGGKLDPFAY
jgi:hypothetical protein